LPSAGATELWAAPIGVGRAQTFRRALHGVSQYERRKFVDDVGNDVMGHIERLVEQGSVEFSFTEALTA
jgi:hypothetical protein